MKHHLAIFIKIANTYILHIYIYQGYIYIPPLIKQFLFKEFILHHTYYHFLPYLYFPSFWHYILNVPLTNKYITKVYFPSFENLLTREFNPFTLTMITYIFGLILCIFFSPCFLLEAGGMFSQPSVRLLELYLFPLLHSMFLKVNFISILSMCIFSL